jgi:hypothetical protein
MSAKATKTTVTTFGPNSITVNGKTFPAEYSMTPGGSVFAFATVQEGDKTVSVRIKIDQNDACYERAVKAAKQEQETRMQAKAEPVAVIEPVAVVEPVAVAEPVAEPVACKPFIGTEITGEGWKIRFDNACGRTRVMLQSEPTAAMRAVIENAGFFWSGMMKSWNKKLTVKAYKAAQALALDLRKLCA